MRAERGAEPSHAGQGRADPGHRPVAAVGDVWARTTEGKETAAGVRVRGMVRAPWTAAGAKEMGEVPRRSPFAIADGPSVQGDSHQRRLRVCGAGAIQRKRGHWGRAQRAADCLGSNPGSAADESRRLGPASYLAVSSLPEVGVRAVPAS